MRAHRFVAAALCLALPAAVAAGCGSSAHSSPLGKASGVTRAQALAFANAVNLTAADVPGPLYPPRRGKSEVTSGPFGPALAECVPAISGAGAVTGFLSPLFAHDNAYINPRSHAEISTLLPLTAVRSGVYFFSSQRDARQYASAGHSARFGPCVRRSAAKEPSTVVREAAALTEVKLGERRAAPLAFPLPGIPGHAVRVEAPAASLARGGTELGHAYVDYFTFVHGNAVIALGVTGIPAPYPTAVVRKLLARLEMRGAESPL